MSQREPLFRNRPEIQTPHRSQNPFRSFASLLPLLRLSLSFSIIALFILFGSLASVLLPAGSLKRRLAYHHAALHARLLLRVLGIRVGLEAGAGDPARLRARPAKNRLILSNHLSYVDVLVLMAVFPSAFITSVEVAETLFLGTLSRLGGALFVERRTARNLPGEIGLLRAMLEEGHDLVLFPEGTTGTGERVLPFKNALFTAALEARADVLPVCLSYETVDGKSFGPENRDTLCYYGEMRFGPHFLRLHRVKTIEARVRILPAIAYDPGLSRKEIGERAYRQIREAYEGVETGNCRGG